MRKIALLGLLVCLLLVGNALASDVDGRDSVGARRLLTFTATGEASGNNTVTMTANDLAFVRGRTVLKLRTIPGAGALAPTAYTISIYDTTAAGATAALLHTTSARSTTATEVYDVPASAGQNIFCTRRLAFVLTGIGEGNSVELEVTY